MNRAEKIMFYYNNNDHTTTYALPTSFYELKLLVDTGYCVMDREDIDLYEFFQDCDWLVFTSLEDLTWRDYPSEAEINISFEMIKELGGLYHNGYDIITEDDLETQFEDVIGNITQNEIVNAQDAIGLEEEYQRFYNY